MKIRLDQYLVQHGLIQSRERAKAMIMSGVVFVNEQKVDKAGEMIKEDAKVEVRGHDIGYVSRGGLKLEKAMQVFPMRPDGKVCMDIGASTGGFTDCMLKNGAVKVYAVDVGYGQLAWSLRTDERVVNMERTNIRNVTPDMLGDKIAFFSVDVSFISLKHIFPVADTICTPDAVGVCLVKPQFEAGRDKVGKKGLCAIPRPTGRSSKGCWPSPGRPGMLSRDWIFPPLPARKAILNFSCGCKRAARMRGRGREMGSLLWKW